MPASIGGFSIVGVAIVILVVMAVVYLARRA